MWPCSRRWDKNLKAGRYRWIFITNRCKIIPLRFGDDVVKYLTKWPVPDGWWLAAPYSRKGDRWRTTQFTAIDAALQKYLPLADPGVLERSETATTKIRAYSCRKCAVQALHDWARACVRAGNSRPLTDADIGEFIGWISTKTDIMKHYAGMSRDHMGRTMRFTPCGRSGTRMHGNRSKEFVASSSKTWRPLAMYTSFVT